MTGDHDAGVAIVVPVYRSQLDEDELISLRHLERHLSRYDRYLIEPRSLGVGLDGFRIERFPDSCFASRKAYSSLCLSKRLYRRFLEYEYILLYQLDCLVFADELGAWCSKGYDFVGAVHEIEGVRMVGNGGFSLRRVERFLAVLTSKARMVDPRQHWQEHWAARPLSTRLAASPRRLLKHLRTFNGVDWQIRQHSRSYSGWAEDWFWSRTAQKYLPDFRKPSNEEAARFAFGERPRETYEAVGRRLPFGCHGWTRFDRAFWEPYLLSG
jgi:Protein of unknown function (DUF5672)